MEGCSFITAGKRTRFDLYMQSLSEAKFVLSPRGHNIDCYRTWEALYAGSVPVVESFGIDSVYDELPVIIVKNMSKITKKELDKEFEKLKLKKINLNKLHINYWIRKINAKRSPQMCNVAKV